MKRALLLPLAFALLPACAEFNGPPEVSLANETNGLLPDPKAPLEVIFSKAIDPKSLKLELAPYVVDDEGNLGDELGKQSSPLATLFSLDPKDGETGGMSALSADGMHLTITPPAPFPAGAPLVLLIEPGLRPKAFGEPTEVRRRIVFGYQIDVKCNAPAKVVPSGAYFLLANVTKPIPTQSRLYVAIDVDPATGAFVGQFTKADRNPDPNRCPTPCASPMVCELVPSPKCVVGSEKAGSPDEYSDFVPTPGPPTGFSVGLKGCTVDQDDKSSTFASIPVDVATPSPPITLRNIEVKALFTVGADGVPRATGSLSADQVLIGTTPSGPAAGDVTMRLIPPAEVPATLPKPTPP